LYFTFLPEQPNILGGRRIAHEAWIDRFKQIHGHESTKKEIAF